MVRQTMFGLSAAMIWIASAAAQDAPPSYQADPSTYKVIFEDQNFRVIAATWKKGETDKPHSHPLPFVVYALDDCAVRVHNPDGTSRELKSKAGTAFARGRSHPRTRPKIQAKRTVTPFSSSASDSSRVVWCGDAPSTSLASVRRVAPCCVTQVTFPWRIEGARPGSLDPSS
jgi:hypothetical protein